MDCYVCMYDKSLTTVPSCLSLYVQNLAFNAEELKEKVMEEFNAMQVWDAQGEDKSSMDLAMDKRMKIEQRIQKLEEEEGKPKADAGPAGAPSAAAAK